MLNLYDNLLIKIAMKKLQLWMFAAAGCLLLTSCSDDDDNNGTNDLSTDLVGTYELTTLNAPSAQDYDNDGDTNTNLVLEGACYNESWISFHEDGTYNESFTSSTTSEGGVSLECDTKISSGTYVQSGDAVTTTRTSGEGSLTMTFTFNASNRTLTRTENNGNYVGFNSVTSLFANLTGNLQMTFTKYTDNDNSNGSGQNDDDNVSSSGFSKLIGNFNLSAFIVGIAQDLDNNGQTSTNLMTESSCYGESQITFNSNGTYEEKVATNVLSGGGLTLTCNTETSTGTWSRIGDRVITRKLSGNTTITTEYMLDASTNLLTRTDADGQYPTFNAITSLFTTLNGVVNLNYTKD